MSEAPVEVVLAETSQEKWILPPDVKLSDRKVILDQEGRQLGEIYGFSVEPPKDAKRASLNLILPNINSSNSVVLTSGWHTWSGVDSTMTGQDVGMGTISERTRGDNKAFVVEPGDGTEKIPKGVGISYGFIDFRGTTLEGTKDVFVGLVPGLHNLESISFQENSGGNMTLTLQKELEGIPNGETKFKIFLSDKKYSDALEGFSTELESLVEDVKPYENKSMWFSWPVYGKAVQESDIRKELEAFKGDPTLKGKIDCFMIDDGWEETLGQWTVDTKKFPDMIGLVQEIKNSGLKAGIWLSPFMIDRASKVFIDHPDWIIRDGSGKEIVVSIPQIQPTGEINPIVRGPLGLDISIPEVREYLYDELVRLSRFGFEVFKLDYLSVIFSGELKNKDKTSVEHYRDFIKEARKRIQDQTKSKPEFVACGAPMLESIGLFEGIRVSMDSAPPSFGTFVDKVLQVVSRVDTQALGPVMGRKVGEVTKAGDYMYRDAVKTAFRRALAFGGSMGLMLDGIHLNDPNINVDPKLKERYRLAFPALAEMGKVKNLFIGDSLSRVGPEGRKEWSEFLSVFMAGEVKKNPNSQLNKTV